MLNANSKELLYYHTKLGLKIKIVLPKGGENVDVKSRIELNSTVFWKRKLIFEESKEAKATWTFSYNSMLVSLFVYHFGSGVA